ncbi:hypothetical protein AGMMS49573_04510 [Endomicrobiia bacterium]|nr:hypothetical protein AGMMS49523_09830 [Endomicrobiia bacterium]GHT09769.1 hypothetical protein AGMMS49532_08590 [Endomicrobiia bacterium]GHT13560.1 hypothetical protein AGMMS49571_07510 [Endomicrobiia bacterium]GHT16071.1 hypothetical protein AGMMS49573_04510 [Endomicrobiia bacterium]GHT18941.1 hypothetical protein AGMMS49929_01600 [Endomicrobiia bacterium]
MYFEETGPTAQTVKFLKSKDFFLFPFVFILVILPARKYIKQNTNAAREIRNNISFI